MRFPSCWMIAVVLLAVEGSAFGASQKDHRDCDKGDGDQAIAGCTRIINDRSEGVRSRAMAYYNRAGEYLGKREFDQGIGDLNEAIQLDPKYANAYVFRGMAYDEKKDYDRAIADYSDAIRLDPKATTYWRRAIAYGFKGDFDRSNADFSVVLRMEPKQAAEIKRFQERFAHEDAWMRYLRDIQNDQDYANWSEPPLDAYKKLERK